MTDLPHVIAGDHPTEEHIRVMEAYMRAEDWAMAPTAWAGRRLTAADYNAAVDWWNGLGPEGREEPPVTLVRAVQTCWACPAQWDAWDADGQTYYLRFRSGVGTVEAVSTPTTTPESLDNARLVAQFRYGDNLLGSIELDLFCELAGIRLADNAEVA